MEKYGITEDEAWAVHEYKSSESYKVNVKLRDGVELTPIQERMVSLLDSALAKLPNVEGTVYRTLSFDDVFDAQEEYDAFLAEHREGDIVAYAAFTSASTKADGHPLADNTKYGITLEIVGTGGRDLDGFGNNFEKEVLFPRNGVFEVTSVAADANGRPYIKMTEVTESGEQRVQLHSEERGDVLQQVHTAPTESIVQEVSEGDTVRGADTEDPLQGVQAEVTVEQQIEQKEELGNQELPKGNNYIIPEKGGVKIPTTPKARYTANVAAIKTLRSIEASGRSFATPEEQAILAKYTGWGGVTSAFDESKADWAKEVKALRNLLDEAEYKTAKASILDAYYTQPEIIRAIYNGLAGIGFKGGRLLEPSAGTGRFLGAMPESMLPGIRSFTAVELDKITGSIAKYLYPNYDVRVQGFETANIPQDYMDVAIGNVPFGNVQIVDKKYPSAVTSRIHNYFIAKSLDKVRPGGIACFITSSGTMDANGAEARAYFMKQADLICAIRLPNTAFETTGTPVVTDILVFKKREAGTPYKGEAFAEVSYQRFGGDMWGSYETNEYFVAHPEMVLGTAAYSSGQYGRRVITYNPLEGKGSLTKQIEKAFGKITAKMDYPVQKTREEVRAEIKADAGKTKEGAIVKKDGKLLKNNGGFLEEATDIPAKDTERMGAIVDIRDTARKLLEAQLSGAGDSEIAIHRKNLNTLYDDFVKKNGILHKQGNARLIHKDADDNFILALENYDKDTGKATKAAIFTKNTVKPAERVSSADSAEEAMYISLNETGAINVSRIAQLTGSTEENTLNELLDTELAYLDRNGEPVPAAQYLAGNVRAKLKDAEALAIADKRYEKNVAALKEIIPKDIAPEDIGVRLGATWVPDKIYSQFASEMLGMGNQYRDAVSVQYNPLVGKFTVTINDNWAKYRAENNSVWGTEARPFVGAENKSILPAALNNKNIVVRYTVGEESFVDEQATKAAQEKLAKVQSEFSAWLWKDAARRTELGRLYNDIFNNTVTPAFDGSKLTFDGLNSKIMPDGKPFSLREHQANAVQRILTNGNTLLAHRVGAGKTLEMAAAAMKLRQTGVIKKPVFVVPNHLVAQWGKEFIDYFPAAKVKVVEKGSVTAKTRKQFANSVALGDWDAVIMSYEQFEAVPMSYDQQEAFYQGQIDALEQAIYESKRQSGRDPSVRDMERSKKSLEAKMKKLVDRAKTDTDNIDFEQLGIDALFVDEAHNFKNLFYTTKMNGVADLGDPEGAVRSFDMFMKVRYLQKLNGGRGVVFATATPIMNSVVELYTMQRYLQSDLLEAKGITDFDAWANQFGEVQNIRRMKPSGTGYDIKSSLAKYKNMAELQQMFRAFSDVIVDAEELPYLDIPKMKGGKRIVVECEPSSFQLEYMKQLDKRAQGLKGRRAQKGEDHIFKIMGEGRLLSYSQHMIDPTLPYEPNGKIMKAVDNLYRIWNDSKTFTGEDGKKYNNGTQLVFCDRGVPGGTDDAEGKALYADMKNLLVGMGVPEEQIAFIHDFPKDEQKAELFKKVNDGDVRILFGSSAKMGTGMNVQRRIVAIHEINAPNRPGDLEQNEGRALRQGNLNSEVEVYSYITTRVFDSPDWDRLKRKATFIHQVMAGEYAGREAQGDGDLAMSAAELSAIASGNPLILEQFDVHEKITGLEMLERAHTKEVNEARQRIMKTKQEIKTDEANLPKMKADVARVSDTKGDKFTIAIGKSTIKERKAAGEALIAEAKKFLQIGQEPEGQKEIGTFGGFKLFVTTGGDMLLRGDMQYRNQINMQSPVGTIQTLENMLDRPAKMLAATERRIEENRAAIKKLEEVIASPFEHTNELASLRVREMEIAEALTPTKEESRIDDDVDAYVEPEVKKSKDMPNRPEKWTAKRVGDETKKPKPLSEIVARIKHDFGINLTTGHIRGKGTRGQYNHGNKGIRTQIANDLPTIAHELGHHFDLVYDVTGGLPYKVRKEIVNNLDTDFAAAYKDDELPSEGLAEYLRRFLQNRETAAIDYPLFTEYFLKKLTPSDLALLENLADEVNAYYSMDADTATSAIRFKSEGAVDVSTRAEKIKAWSDRVYQAWVDANHGIKRFDQATGSNAYTLATNASYADAIASQIITGDLTDANGSYIAPGLKTALSGINLNDKREYRLFGEYLTVKHGPERLAEGMRIFADDRKNSTAWMERRQVELEEQFPAFEAASKRLYAFQQTFLRQWGVRTGLISSETADEWAQRWRYYVPLNRAVGDGSTSGAKRGFANQNSTINKSHGSGLDIFQPVDNIITNIVKMVNAGVRNNVMREITDSAQAMGANALFLEKVPAPVKAHAMDMTGVKKKLSDAFWESDMTASDTVLADKILASIDDVLIQYSQGKAYGDVVTVLKGGNQEFWKINDPLLLQSITTMAPQQLKGILDAYATVSRFMTGNITGNNLIWSLFSNFPRDVQTLFAYAPSKNPLKVFGGMGSAYVNTVKGDKADPLFKEYLALGGGHASYYTADRNMADKARKELARASKKMQVSLNPMDWLSFVGDMIERGPRFATYKILRQKGVGQQEAFYAAMDVTVNFRRGGRLAREVNKIVPFFNASVQGLDKFRRWITASDATGEERKKAIRSRVITYITVSAVMAAMFYGLNNRDDEAEEDYEQLSNYTKNAYWNIPLGDGKYFAIPKPRELGVLASFFETLMERVVGGNDHAFDEFYGYWADNCLPNIVSDVAQGDVAGAIGSFGIVGVGSYMVANRDFLGRPIVSNGLQYLEKPDQYNERTSKIAYWIGQALNTSPQMVDYFFGQVLGGFWKAQKALFPVGGKKEQDWTLGVQSTYVKDNTYSQDLTNWLYEKANASSAAYKSDPDNMDKNIVAKMDGKMTDFYGNYNKLAKNEADTAATRGTRQTVLAMILEYRKQADSGTPSKAQEAVYGVVKASDKGTALLPSTMNTYVKDKHDVKHSLSAVQYVEYQTDYLRLYWEYIEDNLNTGDSVSKQAAIISAAKERAKEQATDSTLKRIGALILDGTDKYSGVSDSDVIQFEAQLDLANDDGSLKQDEVVGILEIMVANGLGYDDAYTLFHSRYDSDKNNPWRKYAK